MNCHFENKECRAQVWDLLVARGALCKVLGTAKAPHVQDTVHLSMAVSFSSVTTDALG